MIGDGHRKSIFYQWFGQVYHKIRGLQTYYSAHVCMMLYQDAYLYRSFKLCVYRITLNALRFYIIYPANPCLPACALPHADRSVSSIELALPLTTSLMTSPPFSDTV